MTEQNKIWQLMARNISGEATNEEIAIFQDFLSQNPAIQQQYEVMLGLWHTSSTQVNNSAENENDIIDRLAISIVRPAGPQHKKKENYYLDCSCMHGRCWFFSFKCV